MKTIRNVFFLLLFLMVVIGIVPMADAAGNIRITINDPIEGDVYYNDVWPAYLTAYGNVDAPCGVRNVSITNGEDTVACGSDREIHSGFWCVVPLRSSTNHITITVLDTNGNIENSTRNITSHHGLPGPDTFWVTGWVVDPEGRPIPDVTISFKRIWDIEPPVTVTTTSRADGFYKIEKAGGYSQLITVKKKGYQTLVRDVRFHWLENRLNLTLEPEGRPISGFGFGYGLSAILVVLIILKRRGK